MAGSWNPRTPVPDRWGPNAAASTSLNLLSLEVYYRHSMAVMRYQFESDRLWNKLDGRKALFLDSNIWIDVADAKRAEAIETRRLLGDLVRDGLIFCPISAALIWELFKQDRDSRLRTAEVMEAWSLNVCYAPTRELFLWEIHRFANRIAGLEEEGRSWRRLYVPVAGYLASSFTLEFPDDFPRDEAAKYGRSIHQQLNALSLLQLVETRDESVTQFLKGLPATPYRERTKGVRALARGDRDKVWRIEAESVFKSILEPAIQKMPAALQSAVFQFAKAAPRDRYGGSLSTLLLELPALHNYVEIMALASEDPNRRDRQSDFYDLEMLSVPTAYANAFASHDKRIRHLLRERAALLKRSECAFCSSYRELTDWLSGIQIL